MSDDRQGTDGGSRLTVSGTRRNSRPAARPAPGEQARIAALLDAAIGVAQVQSHVFAQVHGEGRSGTFSSSERAVVPAPVRQVGTETIGLRAKAPSRGGGQIPCRATGAWSGRTGPSRRGAFRNRSCRDPRPGGGRTCARGRRRDGPHPGRPRERTGPPPRRRSCCQSGGPPRPPPRSRDGSRPRRPSRAAAPTSPPRLRAKEAELEERSPETAPSTAPPPHAAVEAPPAPRAPDAAQDAIGAAPAITPPVAAVRPSPSLLERGSLPPSARRRPTPARPTSQLRQAVAGAVAGGRPGTAPGEGPGGLDQGGPHAPPGGGSRRGGPLRRSLRADGRARRGGCCPKAPRQPAFAGVVPERTTCHRGRRRAGRRRDGGAGRARRRHRVRASCRARARGDCRCRGRARPVRGHRAAYLRAAQPVRLEPALPAPPGPGG